MTQRDTDASPEGLDPRQVHDQLERIVNDPLFTHSRRYPSFLRYVVEQTLAGGGDQLKERTLGIEVFARTPDYDTNLDNVVRSTAAEIRKRLAQYYATPARRDELRIDLPAGSYVPRFSRAPEEHPPNGTSHDVAPSDPNGAGVDLTPPQATTWFRFWLTRPAALLLVMVLLVVIAVGAFAATWRGPRGTTTLDRFWGPVLSTPGSLLLCVGSIQSLHRLIDTDPVALAAAMADTKRNITLNEADALVRLSAVFSTRGKSFKLRDGAVVSLGALNNQWSRRLTDPLRFSLQPVPGGSGACINDSQHSENRQWCRDNGVKPEGIQEDFALVARFRSATTGQWVLVSAGLYRYGTIAGAEFLTDPSLMDEFGARAPAGWETQNLELVLATKVIDQNAARPRIVAMHVWP